MLGKSPRQLLLFTLLALSYPSFIAASPASAQFSKMVVHDSRDAVPQGFVTQGPVSPEKTINLRIAMVSNNMAGLEERLYAVSTPGDADYGKHLSKEDVESFVKPAPETVSKVNAWLQANSLSAKPVSPAGDWISISLPVSKANELFKTTFTTFKHSETGKESVQAMEYSIPAELMDAIEVVHPTTSFPNPFANLPVVKASFGTVSNSAIPNANLTGNAVPSSCASTVTPACLQAMYGIPTTKATQTSNTIGVSGFIEQFAQTADLSRFLSALRPDIPSSTTFTLQTLDGGSNPQGSNRAGIEANLDVQYTIGVATGVPTFFISVGENFQDGDLEGFLDIVNFLLGESNPPHVLTTSYGQNENTISRTLANNLCNAYMQLGARGTSILFASGDGGVAGSQTSRCTTFLPTFPSGCPFMTSVGATTGITETAASFSSGGFSNYFAIPSYQASAVSGYKTLLGSTNSGKFNNTGRGFPDVSAQGDNVEIVSGGQTGLVGGTSCSSPIFASVVALLNDRLVAAGKSPLGFLNPFLYSAAGKAALNDVTTGNNPGCNTNGFPAKAGWDPVTGLGTPNFAKLLTAVGL